MVATNFWHYSIQQDMFLTIHDYTTISTALMFGVCESRACILLSILDDSIAENASLFNITLERTPNLDPKILLITVHGVVHIQDDDGMS